MKVEEENKDLDSLVEKKSKKYKEVACTKSCYRIHD